MIYYISIDKEKVWKSNHPIIEGSFFEFTELQSDYITSSRKKLEWLVNEGYLEDELISVYEIQQHEHSTKELIAWFKS